MSVLSSNITSDAFVTEIQLSNATKWVDNGNLDIDSSDTGIVWALGLNPPNNPSNPDSDFQQHQAMGVFAINMKSAQTQAASVPTQTGGVTQTATVPTITGGVTLTSNFNIGLTHRDKVPFQASKSALRLILGYYRTWNNNGNSIRYSIPPRRCYYPLPSPISPSSN